MQNTIQILWQMFLITLLSTAVIAANIASFKVLKVLWLGRRNLKNVIRTTEYLQKEILSEVKTARLILIDQSEPVNRDAVINCLVRIQTNAKAISVPSQKAKQ